MLASLCAAICEKLLRHIETVFGRCADGHCAFKEHEFKQVKGILRNSSDSSEGRSQQRLSCRRRTYCVTARGHDRWPPTEAVIADLFELLRESCESGAKRQMPALLLIRQSLLCMRYRACRTSATLVVPTLYCRMRGFNFLNRPIQRVQHRRSTRGNHTQGGQKIVRDSCRPHNVPTIPAERLPLNMDRYQAATVVAPSPMGASLANKPRPVGKMYSSPTVKTTKNSTSHNQFDPQRSKHFSTGPADDRPGAQAAIARDTKAPRRAAEIGAFFVRVRDLFKP
jgi:hypothetical protein